MGCWGETCCPLLADGVCSLLASLPAASACAAEHALSVPHSPEAQLPSCRQPCCPRSALPRQSTRPILGGPRPAQSMPERTCPPSQVADLPTTNGPWAQGEGLAMAEQAGATLMQVHGRGCREAFQRCMGLGWWWGGWGVRKYRQRAVVQSCDHGRPAGLQGCSCAAACLSARQRTIPVPLWALYLLRQV